jgi:uncharacterized protein (DUF58 family)
MLTPRGIAVALAAVGMWVAARILGSAGLETVAVGLLLLPFIAALFVRWGTRTIHVKRHLSDPRVSPGSRVTVRLDVMHEGAAKPSFLLLEDRLPPSLGRPARVVVAGSARALQHVSYTIVPNARGRYLIGPMAVDRTDAFGLSRRRVLLDGRDELLVTPEVEDLRAPTEATSVTNVGSARARQLLRTGEEYYTMRGYEEGDDLRRIHWPSVARTGELMIRQDEAARRAAGLIYLDNRESMLGAERGAAFERAVSCAASIGALFTRNGFALRLGLDEMPIATVDEDAFLDLLAGVRPGRGRSLGRVMTGLRLAGAQDTSLVFVGAPPPPQDLPPLVRAGGSFGPKLAVLVHPLDPETEPEARRSQLVSRATQAHLTLVRGGWDCLILSPSLRLRDRWHTPKAHRPASSA